MQAKLLAINAMLAAVLAGLAIAAYFNPQWFVPEKYSEHMDLSYRILVRNTSAEILRDSYVDVLAPVAQTATQQVQKIEASAEYQLIVDELGNQVMRFHLAELGPFAERRIKITAFMAFSSKPNYATRLGLMRFTQGEPLLALDTDPVQRLSKDLQQKNVSDYSSRVHTWLVEHIESLPYAVKDRGAEYAITQLRGDCSEFMYAFVALLRAQLQPARGVAGFYRHDDVVNISLAAYHNWAEFYEKGRWRVADPQMKRFQVDESRYVAFRILSSAGDHAMRDSQSFIVFDKPLHVSLL